MDAQFSTFEASRMKPSATPATATKAHEGERFKALIAAAGLNQDTFAAASGGKLSRVEVNHACTGKNDYRTDKWLAGIASAVGAPMADVYAWRQHQIDEAELVKRARGKAEEEDLQYPARGEATRRLRGVIEDAAIDAVREEKFKGAESYTVLDWMDRMRAEHADRAHPGKKVGRTVAVDDGKPSRAAQLIRSRR